MRILTVGNMYPPHHLGGYELAWQSWVAHAREAGHTVDVLTTNHRQQGADTDLADAEPVTRELPWYWSDHRFPRLGPRAVLALERSAQAILKQHMGDDPDVVCWWAMGGMPLSLIETVRRAGIGSAFVVMDDWCVYGPRVDRWQRLMDRPLLRRAGERLGIPVGFRASDRDRWVFLSEFLRRRVAAVGVRPASGAVAGRGPDPAQFPPSEPGEWGGRLVCVGRLEQRKGQHVALAALAELPGAELELVGDGDPAYRQQLSELARRHGVTERLRFSQPPRAGVAAAYASADAVLFPVQWDEPWGFVPLEAMAVGRPVIATGTGGSAEYLRDGENALLYSPRDDPGALASAVERLGGDAGLRERLVAAGRQTAAAFSEESFNAAVTAATEGAAR